jgi:hypothetical protein
LSTPASQQPYSINKIGDYGLKAPAIAGKGKQVLMTAFFAFHTGSPAICRTLCFPECTKAESAAFELD